jgi:CheY-like chemotaxis protein
MDGFETARHLRAMAPGPGVPIIATSAAAFIHERERYAEAGFREVLTKPIPFERLVECLTRVLGVRFELDRAVEESDRWTEQGAAEEAALLPVALREELREAADTCSVTEARRCAAEVERLCGSDGHLARCVRECLGAFDLAPIAAVLSVAVPTVEAVAEEG